VGDARHAQGEHTFYVNGIGRIVKALVLHPGFLWSRVIIHEPYHGMKHKTVRNRRLLTHEEAARYEAWRDTIVGERTAAKNAKAGGVEK
jgi:F420-0:gamma-glutamyl ligase-like protein